MTVGSKERHFIEKIELVTNIVGAFLEILGLSKLQLIERDENLQKFDRRMN